MMHDESRSRVTETILFFAVEIWKFMFQAQRTSRDANIRES